MRPREFRLNLNATDFLFSLVKLSAFAGGFLWITYHPLPPGTRLYVFILVIVFFIFSAIIYSLVFRFPKKANKLYLIEFVLDLILLSLLLHATGGLNSTFAFAFYLIVAINSFYYGFFGGIGIAFLASITYIFSCPGCWAQLHWTDLVVRTIFIFLLAMTLGFLSERERRLSRKLVRSEQLTAMGMMSSRVAHEIRNPLSSISLNTELLGDELNRYVSVDTTEAKAFVKTIMGEIERLNLVAKEYLQYVGHPKLKYERCDINLLIESLIKFFDEEVFRRKMSFVKLFEENLPPMLIDETHMRQALTNILMNSFDAMPQGGQIFITTSRSKDSIEVSIRDTGIGISREHLKRIFEPFFTTKDIGTGLGLSIARDIVMEHGGGISCDSKKDKGTVFTITLPIAR